MNKATAIAIAALCAAPLCAVAQQQQPDESPTSIVAEINGADGSVSVTQAPALDAITAHAAPAGAADGSAYSSATGFRVQVFADNNVRTARSKAEGLKAMISQALPEYGAYLSFESPYWRLRIGDFQTYGQAEAAMREIKSQFPALANDLRIVRDKISIAPQAPAAAEQ